MIVFATALTDPEAYRRYARPGLDVVAEPGSEVLAFAAVGSISRSYNLLLDAAMRIPDLEALVLVQEDVELLRPDLCATVRATFADGEVALAGPTGATDVPSIAWWEGRVRSAPVLRRYHQHGGGELPAYDWTDPVPAPGDVETLDGSLLVLSPWAVHGLRFDEALRVGHGYDLDLCRQARQAGRRVRTIDVPVRLHRPLELVDDYDLWVEGHIHVATKWPVAGEMPEDPDDPRWRARARRAEADREAARTMAYSRASELDVRLRRTEAELEALRRSRSWRTTRPLRRANLARARLRRRLRPDG